MPTPLEILLNPVSLIIMGMYGFLFLWETLYPGRQLPEIRFWKIRGLLMFFIFFFLSSYLPLIWDKYLLPYQLADLSALPTPLAAFAGIMLYEFGMYIWHRTMHKSDFLWKLFHQMHHSVERLDIPSAFYFSPVDMAGWTMLGSLCFTLIVGLPADAITIILLVTNFFSLFQHSNIRTPQWMGYFVQRPESHTVHHARGIHAYNYSDLPIYDILFGTFRNPKEFEHEIGFYNGASDRIKDMLLLKDVASESKI